MKQVMRQSTKFYVLLWLLGATLLSLSSLGAQSRDANELQRQVFALYGAGRYAEAIPLAEQLLQMAEAKLGRDNNATASFMNTLGMLYHSVGRYEDAELLFKQTIAIKVNALGPEHPEVAIGLNNLATVYEMQSRYAEAESLHKHSLAIREKKLGTAHPDVAVTLNNLAEVYRFQGRYAEAEPLIKRSLSIKEKAFGPGSLEVARSLNTLANLYQTQGRDADTEPLLKRCLAIRDQRLGPWHPDVAQCLNSLAELYRSQGRFAEAEPLYVRGLAIWEKTLGEGHPNVAAMINNLAAFYADQGRYADAEPLHRRSLAIREKSFGEEHPEVAQSLNNLAHIYANEGRYDDAQPLFKRSLAIREKMLGPSHPNVAQTLRHIGFVEAAQKHWGPALLSLRRSATIQTTRSIAATQDYNGDKEGRAQDRGVFNDLVTAAWGLGTEKPGQHAALLNETFEVAQWGGRQTTGAALAQMAARIGVGDAGVAQKIREQQDLTHQWERLDRALLATVSEPPARRNERGISELRRDIAAVEGKLATLAIEIERAFPSYADLAIAKPLPLIEAQRLLAPDEALIIYLVGDTDATFVWAATREGVRWKRINIGNNQLGNMVAAMRAGLDVDDLKQAAAAGNLFDLNRAHDLYGILMDPIADILRNKHHLVIVPSGSLTSLPFHLLVTEKPATTRPTSEQLGAYRQAAWLIRQHAVTILPSVSSLRSLRVLAKGGTASKPLVGFADPLFGNSGTKAGITRATAAARTRSYSTFWRGSVADLEALRLGLSPLPETAAELHSVGTAVGAGPNDLHFGADASEATVKRLDLSLYRVVYFATHGLVAGEIKGLGEPALALAVPLAASDVDDGLLTASEVTQLKLNADWVVLSACNTAAGEKPGSEALSGLARAFFYAGARALLVSHWRVDSAAATRITTSTFEALRSNPSFGRAEALRSAMLAYMNDMSNPWNAYPDFWGPFFVVGEGGR